MLDFIINYKKDKQKTGTIREPLICKGCGGQMEMYEDQYGHRKLICDHCKLGEDVIETEEERYERVKNDIRIKEMKEESENPLKMLKPLMPLFIWMILMMGVLYVMSILFPD